MTEIYFLDAQLARCAGPIDDVHSLVVYERYRECGSFSLELPISFTPYAANAQYVEISGMRVLGLVEKVVCDEGQSLLRIGGRTAEALLADRIVLRGGAVSGELASVITTVLSENAVGSTAGARRIPLLALGRLEGLLSEDGHSVFVTAYRGGQALDQWLRALLAETDASYRIVLNDAGDGLILETYRGLDRTQAQTENSFAVFSSSFASIGDVSYTDDVGEYKNYAYIAGEGEGAARVTAELDLRQTPTEPLRELYVDARDLRSDDGETTLSADAYLKTLLARGRERLSMHPHIQRIEGPAAGCTPLGGDDVPGSMRAGKDFSVGDRCDVVCERLGLTVSERVTELVTVWEGAGVLCMARFGTDYPDLRRRLRGAEGSLV